MEEISNQSEENQSCPEHKVVLTGMTHSTYKGPYPFQTVPMPKIYRILTSVDPMHFLAYSSIMGEPKKKQIAKALKTPKIYLLLSLMQNNIFVWTSPDNTNKYRNKSNKIS